MKKSFLVLGLLLPILALTQSAAVSKIIDVRKSSEQEWVNQFMQFLAIPNVSADPSQLTRNANWIMDKMRSLQIDNIQLLQTNAETAPPAVYGEVKVPGATETIVFYAHYDGQPVDSTKWAKNFHPFKPVLISGNKVSEEAIMSIPSPANSINPDWRIVARGASDDKGGVMSILYAYEAILKSRQIPTCNIKFFFEGEEEAGSPHLAEMLQKHASLLTSNLWIICDGPVHQSGNKQIVFGVRGDANMDITVYGSKRPLHSGHYGNWAPNPANLLVQLLASMKDAKGKVTIKGFYDDVVPLTKEEKNAIDAIPSIDNQMKKELGFVQEEIPGTNLPLSLMLPSLNINGIQSANAGKLAANVIPTTAVVTLDLRLVKGNDYERQQKKVVDHIKAQGYYITDREPTDEERSIHPYIAKVALYKGYNAQRTSLDIPIAKKVIEAIKQTNGINPYLQPSLGGSLPLYLFEKHLKAATITVPIANHDNNQHAENENLRIQNLWNGIETMASIMMMK